MKRLLVKIETNLSLKNIYKYTKTLQLFTSNKQHIQVCIVYKKTSLKMPNYERLGYINLILNLKMSYKFLTLSLNCHTIGLNQIESTLEVAVCMAHNLTVLWIKAV